MFTKATTTQERTSIVARGRPVRAAVPTRRAAPVDDGSVLGVDDGASHSAPVAAAWTAALLFCIIAAFHAALVLGAPWGEYTQGGATSGTLTTPGRIAAAVSCVLSIGMAGAILSRVGQAPLGRLPARVATVLAWFTAIYAVVGVVLNLITRSAAERALWAPVSILLLGLVVFVMVTTHRKPVVPRSERPPAHSLRAER
ncbi:MAG: hypothetical protein ACXWDI_07370 [Nocardioides sp.]